MGENNVVTNAVRDALEAAAGGRDVMANGKLHRLNAHDCPVKAVRAYFVRAMDEAIKGVKEEVSNVR